LIFKLWAIDGETSPFSFPILLPDNVNFNRKHLINHMKRDGIETRVFIWRKFNETIPHMPTKKHLWESVGTHENSDKILNNFIMFGVSPVNSEKNIEKIMNKSHRCDYDSHSGALVRLR
jgi:dTDP-4-amino-4,6-dideoxygalactose transaminase